MAVLFLAGGSVLAQSNDGQYVIKIKNQNHYLAHVYQGGNWVLQDATSFNPNTCLWYSGSSFNPNGTNHNYYFYDGENYRFLGANFQHDAIPYLSTSLPAVSILRNSDRDYYFYDWDPDELGGGGLARGHKYTGVNSEDGCTACGGNWHEFQNGNHECWEVYWLEYENSQWELSHESHYSRKPEEDDGHGGVPNAAMFRDVSVSEHPIQISSTDPEHPGLTGLNVPLSSMNQGQNQQLSATISSAGFSYNYIPAYSQYVFEGVSHYFYNENDYDQAPGATGSSSSVSNATYEWTISGEGAFYLTFDDGGEHVYSSSDETPMVYYSFLNTEGRKVVTVTLTVTYSNTGVTQTMSTDILLNVECQNPNTEATVNYNDVTISWYPTAESYRVYLTTNENDWSNYVDVENVTSHTFTGLEYNTHYFYKVAAFCDELQEATQYDFWTTAEPGLLVYGAVFGGGRMADVTGKTEIVVINCDSIGAVFGGNDIAGTVEGNEGSLITLGVNTGDIHGYDTEYGTTDGKIRVIDVYGGGNGYYAYNGHSFVSASSETCIIQNDANVTTQSPTGWDDPVWTNTSGSNYELTLPKIKKTTITVNNDYVKVDSLFGGAKNAYLTDGGSYIDINGGTVFAVFGGNNVGGGQGYGWHNVTVNGTKTDLTPNVTNTATTGYGRDFGIRYLFGGGNKVYGSTSNVVINGGQCDTIFAGGNAADLYRANVTVNCAPGDFSGVTCGKIYSQAISAYSGSTLTLKDYPDYAWDGTGVYNVRTLFGGNNMAHFDTRGDNVAPNVVLTSGSIGTVYGGGNKGDMLSQQETTLSLPTSYNVPNDVKDIKYGSHVVMNRPNIIVDNLYGGCQMSNVDYSAWVELKNGHVGSVYGGCNVSGDVGSTRIYPDMVWSGDMSHENALKYQSVQGATYVVATGGTVYKNVYAGSNGFYHCNDGVYYVSGIDYGDTEHYYIGMAIPTHNETYVVVSKDDVANTSVLVKGNVYAGGNMAPVGFDFSYQANSSFPNANVGLSSIRMNGGEVKGNVFGGGNMATINGGNEVQVSGGIIRGALYGGNDRTGAVGGGDMNNRVLPDRYNKASDGITSLEDVNTYVGITGTPTINTVFGGGNGNYIYDGTGDMQYCNDFDMPIQSSTFVDVNIEDAGRIGTVYGGGDGVTVTESLTVFLNVNTPGYGSGHDHVGTIFGGNNKGNLEDLVPEIILLHGQVDTVYGGCNKGALGHRQDFVANGTTYSDIGSLVRLRSSYDGDGDGEDPVTPTAKVTGAVFGGCRMNGVDYNSLVLVEGGQHPASMFGGSDISGTIGGTSQVVVTGGQTGNVYGGGNGNYYYADDHHHVYMIDDHSVLVASNDDDDPIISAPICTISQVDILGGQVGASGNGNARNVYGGGYGHLTSTTGNVIVTIGTDTASAVTYCPTVYGDIYGGSALGVVNSSSTDMTNVNFFNGTIHGNVYGGGHGFAETNGNGYLNPNPTTPAIPAVVNGTVHVKIGSSAEANHSNYVNIDGKVFGGNNLAGSPEGPINVDVYRTAHTPANTCPTTVPNPFPSSASSYAISEVYGGGNLAAYTGSLAHVHVHTCDNTIQYVYGGGNAADVPESKVTIDGGLVEYVFGGGNGAGTGNPGANVSGNNTIVLNGGMMGYVFGGSNSKGYVEGTTDLQFATSPTCTRSINELYGGGNQAADLNGITLNVPCGTADVKTIYGGARNADVGTSEQPADIVLNVNGGDSDLDAVFGGNNVGGTIYGNVTLNLYGGTIDKAFGGNNAGGDINGFIQVNVLDTCQSCPLQLNTVYGGGNDAAYTPTYTPSSGSMHISPQVNIIHGTVNNAVYGGGKGSGATVTANPIVTIGDDENGHTAIVGALLNGSTTLQGDGNVYGGGDAAAVDGNTTVIYQDNNSNSHVNNLFGGGNQANVGGTTVNMNSGKVMAGIYGGCNTKGNVDGDIEVNINNGTLGTSTSDTINIFGGGFGGYDDANHPGTSSSGNVTVNIGGATSPIIYGNVYGGSAFGSVNSGNDDVTRVWLKNGKVNGRVYGGGLGRQAATGVTEYSAKVYGGVQVLVDNGEVTTAVYGCNDQNGTPLDTVNVKINGGKIANVVGGGNQADYVPGVDDIDYPAIYITSGEVTHKVVGGGNAANIGSSSIKANPHVNISGGQLCTEATGANAGIYGGCNTSGTVYGNVTVNITNADGNTIIGNQDALEAEIPVNIHGGGYGLGTGVNGNVTVYFGTDDGSANSHSDYPKLYGDLYGGSALGTVNTDGSNTTSVNVLNGSFGYVVHIINEQMVQFGGSIYGGGLGDDVNHITAKVFGKVYVNIGAPKDEPTNPNSKPTGQADLVHCNVYGCNNSYGSPQDDVFVNVYQTAHLSEYNVYTYTQVMPTDPDEEYAIANVFGGGNRANYEPAENAKRPHTNVHYCENTIEYVYGGGNAADVNGTIVTVDGGRHKFIFGGGNGQVSQSNVGEGGVYLTILGGRVGWAFGGCNMHGGVSGGDANIHISGCETGDCPCGDPVVIENYYFGANMATIYDGLTGQTIDCGQDFEFKNVYAGSRLATIYGNIELTVKGGKIGNLFGGCEGSDHIFVEVKKYPSDYGDIENFPAEHQEGLRNHFANHAHDDQYGTGGDIILTLNGGKIGNVYGGCDYNGNIEGSITIIVDSLEFDNPDCRLDINYIFGGNKLAKYEPLNSNIESPQVFVKNGHVNGAVYGGSLGGDPTHSFGNGRVVSNPKVVIGDKDDATHKVKIGGKLHLNGVPTTTQGEGDVFGGGSAANMVGNPTVIIQGTTDSQGKASTVIEGNVFGGARSGNVEGSTNVIIVPITTPEP